MLLLNQGGHPDGCALRGYFAPDRPSFLGWKIEPAPGRLGGIERSPVLEPANGRLDKSPRADAAAPARAARLRNPLLVDLPTVPSASTTVASFWRTLRPVAFYCPTIRFQLHVFTRDRRCTVSTKQLYINGPHESMNVSHINTFTMRNPPRQGVDTCFRVV